MILGGEEEGEICCETADGCFESAMFVLVVLVLFLEEGLVCGLDAVKGFDEGVLGKLGDGQGEGTEGSSTGSLGTSGGVASDDLLLMEQAQLDGDVGIPFLQELDCSSPSINREALEGIPQRIEGVEAGGQDGIVLGYDLLPEEILFLGTEDHQAVPATKVRGIEDEIDGIGRKRKFSGCSHMLLEILVDGLSRSSVAPSKLSVRLLVKSVVLVGLNDPGTIPKEKTSLAREAFVTLFACMFPRANDVIGSAARTTVFFVNMGTKIRSRLSPEYLRSSWRAKSNIHSSIFYP
jgi:hypothetical protein